MGVFRSKEEKAGKRARGLFDDYLFCGRRDIKFYDDELICPDCDGLLVSASTLQGKWECVQDPMRDYIGEVKK